MPHTLNFQGTAFEVLEYNGIQDAADYVKTQLGIIVVRLRLDTIYDSLTGYAVGSLNIGETRAMLDQVWHSELESMLTDVMATKPFPSTTDFLPVIESGVDQLRIRMLATIRPTPALAFQRDMFALERIRKHDPQRVAAYLLIRLLTDNHFQRALSNGLSDIMVRHESAILIGKIIRETKDTFALDKMTRQLIELDARFDLTRLRFTPAKQQIIRGFTGMLVDGVQTRDSVFLQIAEFAQRAIADAERSETQELGNRAMRPAFIEKTHEEVMAGIHAESARLEAKANGSRKAANPNAKPKVKVGKINLQGLNIDALLGLKPVNGSAS